MQAIEEAGILIMHACGGNSICSTCNVDIFNADQTLPPPKFAEATLLQKLSRKGKNIRLSCQVFVESDLEVIINPDFTPLKPELP